MKKARYNGEELKLTDYKSGTHKGHLKCYHCGVEVSYVSTHRKNLGDKKVDILHHFRLTPKTTHRPYCNYIIGNSIKSIVADCADEELITKDGLKYKVRLLLISDDMSKKENEKQETATDENSTTSTEYKAKGTKSAYLSSMRKIMKLRTLVKKNSDLSGELELEFSDKFGRTTAVSWNNFYYDAMIKNDYEKLFNKLSTARVYHPICVDGIVKRKVKTGDRFIINLEPIRNTLNDMATNTRDERVAVSYFVKDEELFNSKV